MRAKALKKLVLMGAATVGLAAGGAAHAASIYLTGHDTLLHAGQNGYDTVILDWLRGAGTASEVPAASLNIAVVGGGLGGARFTGGANFTTGAVVPAGGNAIPLAGAIAGYSSATYYHATTADWGEVLGSDILILLSHTSCGGCDIGNDDVVAINAQSAAIATAFNDGMDIWANAGANNGDYYNFLPPGAVASGAPISGSSGFDATLVGDLIGIQPNNINGFQTHNRFTAFAPAFVVFETRPATGISCNVPPFDPACEIISIGARDARIEDGGVVDGGTDGGTVPEPGMLTLLGLGALGLALMRRRRQS